MNSELQARLIKCINQVKGIPETTRADSSLVKDLGFDSLCLIDLLFVMEAEFQYRFTMRDLTAFVLKELRHSSWDLTIDELGTFVEKYKK